ncbi:MAG TPA: DcaP family trimeric outer membrane transporter [Steroidobacteraceae bacterium]|nr:DcaP family trimeric outer membrane transporter [Steroidobacteraceae bacterium]
MRNSRFGIHCLLAGAILAVGILPAGASAEDSGRSFEIYGFAQADFIMDVGGRLDPAWDDAFRPSKICIDGACGSDGQSSVSVKQSRFGVKGLMPTGTGTAPLNFKFEFDLFGVGVDAGQTTFRLRHAYGEWGQFLAGQTNSLFMDGDVFPNTIDYWGPTGMVFYRNVQIRWTPYKTDTSHFAVAIERPGNDVDPGNLRLIEGLEGLQVQNDEELPDLTAQFRYGGDWGHVQLGGILRKVGFELRPEDGDEWTDGSETGWGLNLGTVFNVLSQDKVLLQVVYGEGIASYMNDGGMDLAPNVTLDDGDVITDVEAEAVPLTGVLAYYDHYWNDRWSTSIGYSYTEVDNTNFQGDGTFNKGEYASTNLLYYPADNLMFGAEVLWGKKTTNGGASDDDVRFQFTAKYTFGTKL